MQEITITHLAGLSGVALVLSSWLWSIAGRDGTPKALRRFGSTGIMAATVMCLCIVMGLWSWWMLLTYPVMLVSCMGYGGNSFIEKVIRRVLFALAITSVGILYALILGGNAWWVYALHIGVAAWTVYLGVKNPVYAAAEEFFIAFLLYLGLMMYPFIR